MHAIYVTSILNIKTILVVYFSSHKWAHQCAMLWCIASSRLRHLIVLDKDKKNVSRAAIVLFFLINKSFIHVYEAFVLIVSRPFGNLQINIDCFGMTIKHRDNQLKGGSRGRILGVVGGGEV